MKIKDVIEHLYLYKLYTGTDNAVFAFLQPFLSVIVNESGEPDADFVIKYLKSVILEHDDDACIEIRDNKDIYIIKGWSDTGEPEVTAIYKDDGEGITKERNFFLIKMIGKYKRSPKESVQEA